MKSERIIVCFTNSYPYGNRETYFETELGYLANHFDKVIILPKYNPYKTGIRRAIPKNAEVWPPLVPQGKVTRIFKGIFNLSPFSFYIREFFQKKVYRSSKHVLIWGWSLIMFRIFYQRAKPILQQFGNAAIWYSYWAEAPLFITKFASNYKKAVRMHRGDFYVSEYGGYLPLRQQIYDAADLLLPISENIASMLEKDYKIDESKVMVNYLGVERNISSPPDVLSVENNMLRVVSCSRIDPIKRVDLLAETVLAVKDRQIEWHHFGDGTEFVKVKCIIEDLPDNIKVFLHGWAEQKQILDFYKKHNVTWFVNVSKHEGVPVSIMEAMSFGIPVIATDAGATRELVNKDNGFLLALDDGVERIKALLLRDNGAVYLSKRRQAFLTWEDKFNAEANFTTLAQRFLEL
ncbi:glycosyltransferase [Olivibacter sp. SDN3]|uniref:glycosyltransferase n=1 Tax=Olivibacter sp. SDN3 TaxID=2764720 RepID=UPI0016510E80|nr:glycosyltransferase [Olivibacter sp. SDN3]QNL51601.1 glycosyltransferase [Olivibacter sp. SDN3]